MASSDGPSISWPLNRPSQRGVWNPHQDRNLRAREQSTIQHAKPSLDPEILPSGSRSLAGISLRGYLLGVAFGLCICLLSLWPLIVPSQSPSVLPLWRVPFFCSTLALFHFLEFYVTAAYNPPVATISAFLLSTNGHSYNAANAAALIECMAASLLWPEWQARLATPIIVVTGLALVLGGQLVRSAAMAQAGTNFNHQVQTRRNDGHMLVTSGIYAWLRHPAYFGFFWWALGTQLVLGNAVCFAAYTTVLWNFFYRRTRSK